MKEDVSKSLLLQFYGLNEEHTVDKSLSTSKALEIFDGVANVVCSSTDNLFSIEQTDAELVPNHPDNHKQDAQLVNSLCLLTLQEITNDEADKDDNPDLKGTKLAIDIVTESSKEENFDAKVEDSLTKNIAKISETLPKSDATKSIEHHLGRNLSCGPMEAENSCPRQTILSKGNLIPSIFSKFDGTCLNLNNAGISVFPINILDKLQTLQMLYLDSNKLSEIPDEFFTTLTNLKWLDVRNNLLKSIPSSIKNHVNIESVLLQGNSIEQLPLELGLAPNLKNLQLAHNPLVFPPQHILDSDTATLVNFLRQKWNEKHPSQTVALNKFEQGATEKKPTTIICYQSCENVGKAKKLKRGAGSVQNIKSSVRTKAWNYKPSNRYGSRRAHCTQWSLNKLQCVEENVCGDPSVPSTICNSCTASLHREGIFVGSARNFGQKNYQSTLPNIAEIDLCKINTKGQTCFPSQSAVNQSNFLHLFAPSPRCLLLRNKFGFFCNINSKRRKLCEVKVTRFHTVERRNSKIPCDEKRTDGAGANNIRVKVFDIITNDRTRLKIKPRNLKEPRSMMGFLRAFLGVKINSVK